MPVSLSRTLYVCPSLRVAHPVCVPYQSAYACVSKHSDFIPVRSVLWVERTLLVECSMRLKLCRYIHTHRTT